MLNLKYLLTQFIGDVELMIVEYMILEFRDRCRLKYLVVINLYMILKAWGIRV